MISIVFVVIGVIGYRIWQHPWLLDELLRTEDKVIADCRKNWGAYIEISNEVETRLQSVMPNPERYIAIKTGDSNLGSYWFGFFGIDSARGYFLMNSRGYTGLIEKPYARKEAEILFDDLAQGYNEHLTGYSDLIGSIHPSCQFMKIAFPRSSKEMRFIGSLLHAPKDKVEVKLLEKVSLFFGEKINKVRSDQTRDDYDKAVMASYERDRKAGRTLADYEKQVKRTTENIFFELPGGK